MVHLAPRKSEVAFKYLNRPSRKGTTVMACDANMIPYNGVTSERPFHCLLVPCVSSLSFGDHHMGSALGIGVFKWPSLTNRKCVMRKEMKEGDFERPEHLENLMVQGGHRFGSCDLDPPNRNRL